MQHIGVHIQDDKGHIIEISNVNFADILKKVYEIKDFKLKFPVLSSIDPYGDTILKQSQVLNIIDELKELDIKDSVGELIEFLQKVNFKNNQFVCFIGD